MKKALSLVLALVLCLSLCACSNGEKSAKKAILGSWGIVGYSESMVFTEDGKATYGSDEYDWWYDKDTEKYFLSVYGITFTFVIEEDEYGRFFTADGENFYYVENNSREEIDDSNSNSHIHEFGEWETVKEATCTEAGVQQRVCECGEAETQEIETVPHVYENMVCVNCGENEPISEGFFYEKNSDGTGYIVANIGTCTDTEIHIPGTYKDLPVTGIADEVFANYTDLTSIYIPDSVTTIGNSAFYGCSNLTDVTLSSNLTSISYRMFYECESLSSIVIPDGVVNVGEYAFWGCDSLISVTFPDSVTSIAESAFQYCDNLASITVGSNAIEFGRDSFYGCPCLADVYISNLTAWCNNSYHGSTGSFTCQPLVGGTNLYINGALATEIEIPDGVTRIPNWAFAGCSSLTDVVLPDSVTSIGESAFDTCSNLTSITIPGSVTGIDHWAFDVCDNLADIYYDGTYAQWNAIDKDSEWVGSAVNYTLHCTDGDFTRYE